MAVLQPLLFLTYIPLPVLSSLVSSLTQVESVGVFTLKWLTWLHVHSSQTIIWMFIFPFFIIKMHVNFAVVPIVGQMKGYLHHMEEKDTL